MISSTLLHHNILFLASVTAKKLPIMDIRYRCDKHVGIPNTECPCAKKSQTFKKGEFVETIVNPEEAEESEGFVFF